MPTPWQTSCTLGVLHYVYHRHYKDNTFLRERLMRDRFSMAKTLTRKHLKGHFGCVNAIEFSNDGGGQIVSGEHEAPSSLLLPSFIIPASHAFPDDHIDTAVHVKDVIYIGVVSSAALTSSVSESVS